MLREGQIDINVPNAAFPTLIDEVIRKKRELRESEESGHGGMETPTIKPDDESINEEYGEISTHHSTQPCLLFLPSSDLSPTLTDVTLPSIA